MNSKKLSLQHFYAFFLEKANTSPSLLECRRTKGFAEGPVTKTGP